MKSIGKKIMFSFLLMVGASLIVMGVFSCIMSYASANRIAKSDLQEIAAIAASRAELKLASEPILKAASPDGGALNSLVEGLDVSKEGGAYIIDRNGSTIAALNDGFTNIGDNMTSLAESDKSYKGAASVNEKMLAGESGIWTGRHMGKSFYVAYCPISGSDGWSIAVYSPVKDFLGIVYQSIFFTVVVVAAAMAVSIYISVNMGVSIGRPVRLCTERIDKLASGDLTSPVPDVRSKDETGVLADATMTVVSKLNGMIRDMGRILEAMAEGDFSVDTEESLNLYTGDFEDLRIYAEEINTKLSSTMSGINDSADQVSASADQVSDGAQALSAGATEQASSIEELAATIHVISDQVTLNSENCAEARSIVKETSNYVVSANNEMERLTKAMNEIDDASGKIGKIIKTIEDIAFQTNILALNAAVEAARAGDAGKGFAVVADEVRNLASKSAEAAQETTELIERSIAAVKNGTAIAAQTASAMNSVGERTSAVEEIVDKIASASEQQADMIEQVTTGVEQISGVVQNNSATAEQSAAASEELSGQASILKEMMGKFALKERSAAQEPYGSGYSSDPDDPPAYDNDHTPYSPENNDTEEEFQSILF